MAVETSRSYFGGSMWRNIFITAGIAIVAPYVIRRVLPLLRKDPMDVTANDWAIAGKDSVRDVADDLGVGGVSGTLNRAVDRVGDRLRH